MMSAWDVVRHEFESPHVRSFLLWQAFQTLVPVDAPGSGPLAYSIVFGRQRRSWTLPRGGSGSLTDALVRCIEDAGGTRRVRQAVSPALVLEGGRCAGVETADGERYLAREAVVSTIHVKHLVDMAPAEAWGEDFRYGVDTYDIGISGMAGYLATTEPPVFDTRRRAAHRGLGGLLGLAAGVVDHGRALRDGRHEPTPAWLLVATPTLVDDIARARRPPHGQVPQRPGVARCPTASPAGTSSSSASSPTSSSSCAASAPNLTDDVILGHADQEPRGHRARPTRT